MNAVRLRRTEARGSTYWRLVPSAPLTEIPAEGTVVALTRSGYAVVRGGALVAVSDTEALDLVDPADAAERRYTTACVRVGYSDRVKRVTVAPGEEWEADTAYPVGDGPALIVCERVRGRHVWVRRATWAEAVALGVRP